MDSLLPSNLLTQFEDNFEKLKASAVDNVVTDDTPDVISFLSTLEKILRHGLKASSSLFGGERDYWNWIENLKNSALHYEILHASNLLQAKTSKGKGRAFLRYALQQKSLPDAIQLLLVDEKLKKEFYSTKAFLFNDYCSTTFINLLYEVNNIQFQFNHNDVDIENDWVASPQKMKRTSSLKSITSIASKVGTQESLNQHGDLEKKFEELKITSERKLKEKDEIILKLKEQAKNEENTRIATQLNWNETKQNLTEQINTLQHLLKSERKKRSNYNDEVSTPEEEEEIRNEEEETKLDMEGNFSIELPKEKEYDILDENDPLERKYKISAEEYQLIKAKISKLRNSLLSEQQANSSIKSAGLLEKEQYVDQLSKSSSELLLLKEQEKVKIEEVEELRTELVRRKEWIMEVERQKNESIEFEEKLRSENKDLRKDLEIERKKCEVFEKNMKFLEDKMKKDVSEAQNELRSVKVEKDKFHQQYEDILAQHETLDKEYSSLKDEFKAESNARRQLEESCKDMEEELSRLSQKMERETSQLGALVMSERKSKDEFVAETQKLLVEFQKEVEDEKTRRIQILKQLEAERNRISMQKWAKDEGVNNCSACNAEFSLWKRKHHCRTCGNIFCHACSSQTALTTASPRPVRVCDDCYAKIEGIQPPPGSVLTILNESLTVGLDQQSIRSVAND